MKTVELIRKNEESIALQLTEAQLELLIAGLKAYEDNYAGVDPEAHSYRALADLIEKARRDR